MTTTRRCNALAFMFVFALGSLPGARAAVDPASACDAIDPNYIVWQQPTTAPSTAATAPAFDTSFPGVAIPATYFAQGKHLLKFRSSDGVKQWAWCPPNTTNCSPSQGSATILNSPAVVPLSNPGLHGCGEAPCVFIFLGGSDGFLYRLDAATGTSALAADTRRTLGGVPVCTISPGDAVHATPAVVLYASADSTPGSRGRAFRDDIDATPGHAGDDVVIVVTANGCGDTTRNRIIAYWAKDLTRKWIFNVDGAVKVDRSMEGCTIDYAAMRLYCGTDRADNAIDQSSLFALDIITGVLLWSDNAGAILNRPMLNFNSSVLFVANKPGALMAYDPAGHLGGAAPIWSNPVSVAAPGTIISKSPSVGSAGVWQNRVLVLDSGGTLHAVKHSCTGSLPDVVNDSVRVSRAGTNAVVSWTDAPGSFNVYRGSRSAVAWSYNQTCFTPMVTGGPVTDSDVPPPGTAAYYLITRVTACGESTPGEGRPNPSPCPFAPGSGSLLWDLEAGLGGSFKSLPVVLSGTTEAKAFIGRSDGYAQMINLTDSAPTLEGIVTVNPSAPGAPSDVFDPSIDPAGGNPRLVIINEATISRLQMPFCSSAPY
jgi:hypothetical protein